MAKTNQLNQDNEEYNRNERDSIADYEYNQAILWAEQNVWATETDGEMQTSQYDGEEIRAIRPIKIDEDGELYFDSKLGDFDKDETPTSKMYLDYFEGWKPEYKDPIKNSLLTK